MTEPDQPALPPPKPAPQPKSRRPLLLVAVALVGGLAVGAGVTKATLGGRSQTLVALQPAPITAMRPWTAVAVKGAVGDIFGGRFVVQDQTGKALVDTGPDGEDTPVVAAAETVIVQGRFEHGMLHAMAVTHADGRTQMFGPPGPHGPRGPLAWLGHGWGRAPGPGIDPGPAPADRGAPPT